MPLSFLSSLHLSIPVSCADNKASLVGPLVKRKTSSVGYRKVAEALIITSSKHKSVKKTRREEKKPKTLHLRISNTTLSEKENGVNLLPNSANSDPNNKLGMVIENGESSTEVISKDSSLKTPGRDAVLKACTITSGIFAVTGLTIRQVSHVISEGGLSFPDCTRTMPYDIEWSQAETIAALVVLISACRQLLLNFWPEFADSSKAANRQVLGSLDIWDYVVVSFLPGIGEELLFRGALLPIIGIDWKGVTVVGLTFGALHLGGGRKSAFALWASFVGIVYGFAAVSSSSLIVPIAAHSLNNLIGGLLWRYFDLKEDGNSVDS